MKIIDETLMFASLVITNAPKNPEMSKAFAVYGYDKQAFDECRRLKERVEKTYNDQRVSLAEQVGATDKLNKVRREAKTLYVQHVKLARIALRLNNDVAEALALPGLRAAKLAEWIRQAEIFYHNALKMYPPELKRVGLTKEVLKKGQELIKEVSALHYIQLQKMSDAQQATKARNEAFADLKRWLSDFRVVSRIAMVHSPQLLESVGILVRS